MILKPEDGISAAVSELREGGIVCLPTETVYGLAGFALKEEVVRKIFEIKDRPFIDPLIVHVLNDSWVDNLVLKVPIIARKLMQSFWPGPLTIVFEEKNPKIPDLVTAGHKSVAIRCPKHQIFRMVLEKFGHPLAAPSANPFGFLSPTRAEHVQSSLGKKINIIIDGGECDFGLESTIVDLRFIKDCNSNDEQFIKILRPGPISKEEIEIATKIKTFHASEKENKNQNNLDFFDKNSNIERGEISPGLMDKHYSPKTKLILLEKTTDFDTFLESNSKIAVVYFSRPKKLQDFRENIKIFWLTESESEVEKAAKNLFHLLQVIDKQSFDCIFIEKAPDFGIGIAINNRLKRASAK